MQLEVWRCWQSPVLMYSAETWSRMSVCRATHRKSAHFSPQLSPAMQQCNHWIYVSSSPVVSELSLFTLLPSHCHLFEASHSGDRIYCEGDFHKINDLSRPFISKISILGSHESIQVVHTRCIYVCPWPALTSKPLNLFRFRPSSYLNMCFGSTYRREKLFWKSYKINPF